MCREQQNYILMESRVAAANVAQVALEVLNVDGVESNDGRVQTNVCFCEAIAVVVRAWVLGKMVFGAVERLEELGHSFLVSFLGAAL